MTELKHLQKLDILLSENAKNISRSQEACEKAGIDADFTMGDAIKMFIHGHGLHDISDLRNEYHDAMHIAAQAPANAKGEAVAAIFEQTLLREPYNGDLNQKLTEAAKQKAPIRQMIIGTRRFNPSGQEDFEVPAPPASFESAMALAEERFNYSAKTTDQKLSEDEMKEVYDRALLADEFFQGLMGGRIPYQLHLKELEAIPLAFFGLQQVGTEDELVLQEIPPETRGEILQNLGDQNTTLHLIDSARTEAELARVHQPEHPEGSEHLEL